MTSSTWGCVSNEKNPPSKAVTGGGETCLHLDLLKGRPCQGFQIITSAGGDQEGFCFVVGRGRNEEKNKGKGQFCLKM